MSGILNGQNHSINTNNLGDPQLIATLTVPPQAHYKQATGYKKRRGRESQMHLIIGSYKRLDSIKWYFDA